MPLARSGIAGVLTSSQGGGGSGSPVADHMAMLVGTNTENAVRPGAFSTGQWQESLFGVWTSGAFVPGWSTHGAYVLGGGGGHGGAENYDCCLFDFADYTYKYLPNTNGVAASPTPVNSSQTTGAPYWEMTGTQVPAPGHLYSYPIGVGSDLLLPIVSFATSDQGGAGAGSTYMHRCTLNGDNTCTWSRVGTNTPIGASNGGAGTGFPNSGDWAMSFYEQARNRLWFVNTLTHVLSGFPSCDPNVGTWSSTSLQSFTPDPAAQNGFMIFDEITECFWYAGQNGRLYRCNFDATTLTGWTDVAAHGLSTFVPTRWVRFPSADGGDDCFYAYLDDGTNTLRRFNRATMAFDTVSVGGSALPTRVGTIGGGVGTDNHFTRFLYVPARQCFAWIAGNAQQVALLRP